MGNARLDKQKLESRLLREISETSDIPMTPPLWQKPKRNWRASWRKWKGRVKNMAYNSTFKNEDHGIWFHHFMTNRWGNNGNSDRLFFFLGSKITADGDYDHEIKRCLLLGREVMTNLHSMLKSRDITLPTEVCLVKVMVFSVVMYGCESWTIKKVEHWRIDAFDCGVGENSWESLGKQGYPASQF